MATHGTLATHSTMQPGWNASATHTEWDAATDEIWLQLGYLYKALGQVDTVLGIWNAPDCWRRRGEAEDTASQSSHQPEKTVFQKAVRAAVEAELRRDHSVSTVHCGSANVLISLELTACVYDVLLCVYGVRV
jgi:hypothetical protein